MEKEDIIRLVRENDVKFIRLQVTDIFGQLKNVAITASQIEKAVDNQIMRPVCLARSEYLHPAAVEPGAGQCGAPHLRCA